MISFPFPLRFKPEDKAAPAHPIESPALGRAPQPAPSKVLPPPAAIPGRDAGQASPKSKSA